MKFKFLLFALTSCFVVSCNSNDSKKESNEKELPKNETIVKANKTELRGDLKGCYEVIDKDYKIKRENRALVLRVELMRTDQELPYERKDVVIYPEAGNSTASYCAGFGIELLDIDGNVLDKLNAKSTPYSWDEVTEMLQLLPEETGTIQFHVYTEVARKDVASFRITSIVEENTKKSNNSANKDDLDEFAEELGEIDKTVEVLDKSMDVAGEMLETSAKMAGDVLEIPRKMK